MSDAEDRPGATAPVQLGALERQVMEALWDQGDRSVRDLITALGDRHAYTTIATVLSKLERKGMIVTRHEGRRALHSAQHTRCEHAARAMEAALEGSRDRQKVIRRFVRRMDPADMALLRECLEQEERTSAGDGGGE